MQDHGNISAPSCNFLTVPLARRLLKPLSGGHDIVDRSMILGWPKFALINGSAVIEDLYLHALVRSVPLERRANADAVVRSFKQAELETQNEVRILFCSKQISATIRGTNQKAVFDYITATLLSDNLPAIETLPIEQRHEARFSGAGRYRHHGCQEDA